MQYLLLAGVAAVTGEPAAAPVSGEPMVEVASATQETADTGSEPAAKPQPQPESQAAAIVVTSTRSILPATALPLTVDVLGGDDLREQIAVSGSIIDAISARMPAFSPTREKLSGSGENLRGRSPLFAINGVPQSTPVRDGSRDGYTIDPFFVERVEVIYGSNALQGIGATGGVINQVTVGAPQSNGLRIRLRNEATAHDGFAGESLGAKTAALAAYRSGAFDVTGGFALQRRGMFEDAAGRLIGVDGTQGEIQDSDSWSLFGRAGYQLTDSARLEVIGNLFNLEGNGNYVVVPGFPTTSEKGPVAGAPPSNRAQLLSASLTDRDLLGGNLVAQAFFSRTRDIFGGGVFATFQDAAIAPVGTLFDQSVNKSRKIGGKLSYERAVPGLPDLLVTAGVDMLVDRTAQSLLQTSRDWVPQSEFRSIAPFVQGNLALLGGKVRLSGGGRFEDVKLKVPDFTSLASYGSREVDGGTPRFSKMLVNGGVVVEPVDGLRAYGAYAEGYTIADVGRILRGINVDGVDVDNFLSLEPVVSNNREIGVEWRRGPITASASHWWSDSKLGSRLRREADGIFSVVRAPISLRGLDLNAQWRTPVPGLSLGGAYAHVHGRTDDDNDGSLETDLDGANIAPDRLNLHVDLERGPLSLRLMMRNYFKREFDGPSFTPESDFDGYALFDALVGYSFGAHRATFGVQNLADKDHITYYSDTVGLDDVSYFAGRGRTFTLGVTSSF